MDYLNLLVSNINLNDINPKMHLRIKLERELLRDFIVNKNTNENEFDLEFGYNVIRIVIDDLYPFRPPKNIYILDKNSNKYDFFDFVESNYNIYDASSLKEIQRLKDIVNTDKMNWKPNMTLKYLYNKLTDFAIYCII
tara:strand:+ start:286 stop:699 length:414 start_codon:yes stop_codon:yes gene_type:complete